MARPDGDEPLEARLVRSFVVSVARYRVSLPTRKSVDVQHTNASSNCPRHVKQVRL